MQNETQIILVRHGQDEDNANGILNGHRDTPLTELGKDQAREAAIKLKGEGISVIYTSPLIRAKQTAEIISEEIKNVEVRINKELIERNFGVLTGKRKKDIPKYSKDLLETSEETFFLQADGAEDFPMLLERAKRILKELESKHKNEKIILVTHGDLAKMLEAAFNNWDWKSALHTPYMANGSVLYLKTL